MPRTTFTHTVVAHIVNALEGSAKSSELFAGQFWNAACARMMSTVARHEASSPILNIPRMVISTPAFNPGACGEIRCSGHSRYMSTSSHAALVQPVWATDERARGLAGRLAEVMKHFPTSLSIDDFISRVEIALAGYGFTGDNTIGEFSSCMFEVWLNR